MLLVYAALGAKSAAAGLFLVSQDLGFQDQACWGPLLPELLKTLYQNEFTRRRGRDLALLPHEKSCRAHQAVVLSRGTTRGHSECWITGTERPLGRADMTCIESSRF